MNIDPSGGTGVGPDPSGTNYPFVSPSSEIDGVLADFYISYSGNATLPLSLAWFAGADVNYNAGVSGPATAGTGPDYTRVHAADVVVTDATGHIVFNSNNALSFTQRAFSNRLYLYEWANATTVCRLVQHSAAPAAANFVPLPSVIKPANGVLDERCSDLIPTGVRSINGATTASLLGGYNVVFTPGQPAVVNFRTVTPIVVDVIPGAGAGRYNGCLDEQAKILTVNEVKPDATGNLMLNADGCTWIRQAAIVTPTSASVVAHSLTIGDDCEPCCKCEDYTRLGLAALAAFNALAEIGIEAQEAACRFQGEIDRWRAQKACREHRALQFAAVAFNSAIEAGIQFCNGTDGCLHNLALTITATATNGAAVNFIPGTAVTTDGTGGVAAGSPTVAGNTITFSWGTAPPSTAVSANWRYGVVIPAPPTGPTPTSTDVTLTATSPGGPSQPDWLVVRTLHVTPKV